MRVAIIGCGKISQAHISAVQAIEKVEICGVCDRDRDRAGKASRLAQGANAYSDLARMLKHEQPDAIHVLTPPATHAELAIQAMEAGCHILVEKPMALSVQEAEKMLSAARANGVKLCPNHNYLYKPSIARARHLIESGAIGQVVHVSGFYGTFGEVGSYAGSGGRSHWASRLPGGFFTNFLPHLVYLLLAFIGDIDTIVGVTVIGSDMISAPSELHILLEGSGVTGVMNITMRTKPYTKFVDIYGTQGIIHADLVREVYTINRELRVPRMLSKAIFSLESSVGLVLGTAANTMKVVTGRMKNMPGLQVLVREFYTSIRDDQPPPVLGEEGRNVARIMEMIWEKSETLANYPISMPAIRVSEDPKTDVECAIVERGATFGRVLVTGATGFLGHHLVAALKRCGADVVALVRNAESVSPELKAQAEIAVGDLRDCNEIATAMRNVDIVYHCAAVTTNQTTWTEHFDTNVSGTETVLQEALRADVKRVIHISSVIVYGLERPPSGRCFRESEVFTRTPDRWAYYLRSKLEADRLALQHHYENQLPVTVLRLGALYGPGGGRPPGRGLVQLGPLRLIIGRGRNRLPFTYISNAVDCLLLAAITPEAIGKAYNVVDEPQTTGRDVALQCMKITGERSILISVPPLMLSAAALMLEWRSGLNGSQTPPRLSRFVVRSSCRNICYDTTKAHDQLGWRSEVTLDEGLRRTLHEKY